VRRDGILARASGAEIDDQWNLIKSREKKWLLTQF